MPKVVKGVSPGIGVKARTLRSLALIITIFSISTAGTESAGAFLRTIAWLKSVAVKLLLAIEHAGWVCTVAAHT